MKAHEAGKFNGLLGISKTLVYALWLCLDQAGNGRVSASSAIGSTTLLCYISVIN